MFFSFLESDDVKDDDIGRYAADLFGPARCDAGTVFLVLSQDELARFFAVLEKEHSGTEPKTLQLQSFHFVYNKPEM